jgi:hypothetical protein
LPAVSKKPSQGTITSKFDPERSGKIKEKLFYTQKGKLQHLYGELSGAITGDNTGGMRGHQIQRRAKGGTKLAFGTPK